jgi:hypothetical protein
MPRHGSEDRPSGCRIGTKCPVLHAKQGQTNPIGFSDGYSTAAHRCRQSPLAPCRGGRPRPLRALLSFVLAERKCITIAPQTRNKKYIAMAPKTTEKNASQLHHASGGCQGQPLQSLWGPPRNPVCISETNRMYLVLLAF